MDDVARLRAALAPIEQAATGLHWAQQRPWRAETHVFWQSAVPTVDLHDLNAKLARQLVGRVVELHDVSAGAVCLVTGRGRHSMGQGVLGKVVGSALRKAAAGTDWQVRPAGASRWVVVFDRDNAPAAATGALGWGLWLLALAFGAAVIAVVVSKILG